MLRALAILTALALGGCGLTVPRIDHAKSEEESPIFVQAVTKNVHCQLRQAVLDTYRRFQDGADISWLRTWSAQVTLTINVDEKTSLNPGLVLTKFFPNLRTNLTRGDVLVSGRQFDFGFGGTLQSTAARQLEITWFVVFADFFRDAYLKRCQLESEYFIEGDLKIEESLRSGALSGSIIGNISDPFVSGGRLQSVQHRVSFEIVSNGNVTPRWSFANVSANTGGPLLELDRTRTDTLLITMGPTQLAGANRPLKPISVPSQSVINSHLAGQIGEQVANALSRMR